METKSDSEEDIPLALLQRNHDVIDDVNYKTLQTEETAVNDDSEDDLPLAILQNEKNDIPILQVRQTTADKSMDEGNVFYEGDNSSDDNMSLEEYYDSDRDPEYKPGKCKIKMCKNEVWATCQDCDILLCFDHFNQDIPSCSQHDAANSLKRKRHNKPSKGNILNTTYLNREMNGHGMEVVSNNNVPSDVVVTDSVIPSCGNLDMKRPEHYTVEGSEREIVREKTRRTNNQKEAKLKRNLGQEYVRVKTKKKVPAKEMKARCKGTTCRKQCSTITDGQRQEIFRSFYDLADLRLQREFLVRHIKCSKTKEACKSEENTSRRQITKQYFLTIDSALVPVCKIFFLNTLGVSEQTTRTALSKLTPSGTITKENRGGRKSEAVVTRDTRNREEISAHIDKFPRVESHFCRSSTSREYLHPDLTKRKMYNMFLAERAPQQDPPSFFLYKNIFKEKNLSIHRPKKDQCSLCATYLTGDEHVKETLGNQYRIHESEKNKVRELKTACKKEAMEDKSVLCASFDLQQVIYLPVSNESALFYKRRLSNYNLTFYNLADRNCHCYVWDETTSKRGASEISTCVYNALKLYDSKGVKKAYLFCDGCGGQNKNSITPAMMLYMVTNFNIQEISVRFFATNHGQNESDSAHSAISQAIKSAGDLFMPSQLATVFSLARPQQPYVVHRFQFEDFFYFKALLKELRILDTRRYSGSDELFNWNSIMELKVTKQHPDTVFYKTSHHDNDFKALNLKRLKKTVKDHRLQKLTEPNRISKAKYNDLVSLCSGATPVIKLPEHKNFYVSLPHD